MSDFNNPVVPPRQGPPPLPRNGASTNSNGMATAGLVLGIILCIPVCSVLAIIFSAIGLSRLQKLGGAGRGQAIAGLVLGIVGIVVMIPVDIFYVIPNIYRASESANRIKCASNMRQIGIALTQYGKDNAGAVPPSLDVLVKTEDISDGALKCPDVSDANYVLVATRLPMPPDAVVLYEPLSNHTDGSCILYGDGHVEFLSNPAAQQLIANLQNGTNAPVNNNNNNVDITPAQPTVASPLPAPSAPPVPSTPQAPRTGSPHISTGRPLGALVNMIPDGAVKTAMIGGNGGSPYVKVDREKRPIIGFTITIGHWGNHQTIGHCEPLYETPTNPPPRNATYCLAKEGYVVGGIIVNKIEGADGIQILFMRLKGDAVDTADNYQSPWFGETKGSNQTQLAGHGERVIGTFGRQGMNMDALGLVVEPAANDPAK